MRNLTDRNIAISGVSGKGLPVPSLGAETVPSSGRPSLAGTLGVWRASQSSAMSALPILELDHLFAISERTMVPEPVTDVLVRRGDRAVVRSVAANEGALFSHQSYSRLIKRAGNDGVLAIAVGQRSDLPEPLLQQLLVGSVDL